LASFVLPGGIALAEGRCDLRFLDDWEWHALSKNRLNHSHVVRLSTSL